VLAGFAAVSLAWFLYLGSSIPRLRGFQIYTQKERYATSSARALAGAYRSRHRDFMFSRESVLTSGRAGVVRVKKREDDGSGECTLGKFRLRGLISSLKTISTNSARLV